jgi:ABC-2 type transport system permease protein
LLGSLGIGLAVSSVTETQQTAMLLAYMLSMIPSFILSGFVFPISSMPYFIQAISYLMPARYFMVITRGIYLKGVGFDVLWPQALFLLIFGSLLILISAKRFKTKLE